MGVMSCHVTYPAPALVFLGGVRPKTDSFLGRAPAIKLNWARVFAFAVRLLSRHAWLARVDVW